MATLKKERLLARRRPSRRRGHGLLSQTTKRKSRPRQFLRRHRPQRFSFLLQRPTPRRRDVEQYRADQRDCDPDGLRSVLNVEARRKPKRRRQNLEPERTSLRPNRNFNRHS